ncbi:PR domain zinc finger protein 2 isoform X2 [Rhinatrema bivittatum]|nr:PR domain zinc finger protein 2 isoform X2 [Rhinatrema bivittatum]
MCVDATDPKKGNWLRYVNWARSEKEQNLCPLEINRAIYYKTLKPIEPGEELLVWYNGEDNPEIAAAIEEERASNRSKKNSPKAKKGKKKHLESRKRGNKKLDSKQRRPESDIFSAAMKDFDQGPKEEDEKPSVSAILSVEQTVVIQEMVNQDALPKFMASIPSCKPQNLSEDRPERIATCKADKNIDGDDDPKGNSERDSTSVCETPPETVAEQKCTNEENSESSPKKKPVVKPPKTKGELYGDLSEAFMFPCQHCERKFTTKQGLERHMHIHVSAINHAFKCRYCGKAFGTQINRRRHERRHEAGPKKKPSTLMTSEDSQTTMDDASHKSADEQNAAGVLQDFRTLDSEKGTQEISNCLAEENGGSKELHPCKYCKKVFGTHTNVRRHQRRVHERHLIPKGVRRKGCLLEEPRLQTEQTQKTQNVYITNTETEEDGEADDIYIMDISNNISENLNYYIDGKIQSNNSTSNCEVIEVESNSADIYGLNCLLTPVTVEISQNIKTSQPTMTDNLQKESSSSGKNDPKKRRTASPPLLPKIKTEVETEPITASCSHNLPLNISVTDSLPFHKEKNIYLSSKLKQLLQTQDNNKINPTLLTEVAKLGPATSSSSSSPSILPTASNRFKRRTSTPPSSPQHSPALRDFGKQSDGKMVWNDGLGPKIPKLESHESSPAWSLSGRDERENMSPLCADEYKLCKDWTANITFGNVCNQQPLDLSSGVKQRSENNSKTQVPWESVLDLSVQKKSCSITESKELKGNNSVQATCSGIKKKKPTTSMLQKVLLNEYNGMDVTLENASYLNRSPSPCGTEESAVQPDLGSCSPPPAVTSSLNSPSSPLLQPSEELSHSSPPHLTLTNVPSPQQCPPVLSVATSPPPLLPSVPSPIPDSSSSSSPIPSCSSPLSVSSQSPLPVLSPTGSLSPSPIPSDDDRSNSITSLGPPTLSSSSSSSSSSSTSITSSSSSCSSSPPPLSVISPHVNLEPLPAKLFKEEAVEEEITSIEKPKMGNEQDKVPETFNKNFVCNVCESPFLSIKDLTKHLSVHAEDWPFKCEFCVQLFRDAPGLSEHRFLLHGVGKIFVCSVCKKEFAFLCNLHQHQQDLHPDKEYTHHELEGGTLRPQNFTDPSKANMDHIQNLPVDSLPPSQEEDGDLNDSSEELYTTIKIMASGEKTKDPDVRMGLNQHYPSFKPPPFQYHNRNPLGIGTTATNFTTHNIPQTFTTAIRCTKCGKSVDNMPELHKHILVCASASDKKRYTPQKNPVPLKQTVYPKNGLMVLDNSGKNAFRRIGQPKKLNFSIEISKLSSNKLKLTALKKKNQIVHKAILQKKKSAKQKADLKNASDSESHICPFCNREFTYVGSLNKHAAYSCPKKPMSPTSKKNISSSSKKGGNISYSANREKGSSQRRRTADAEIKMQGTQTQLGKTRARSSRPVQMHLPCTSLKSKQSAKYLHVRSKKKISAAKHPSLLRMVKMTPGEVKKSKAMAQSHASQALRKPPRKLHVRVQKNKAILQSKSTLANKKRLERFSVKSRERTGGPITRSSQLAATVDSSESRKEENGRQEVREFRNLL